MGWHRAISAAPAGACALVCSPALREWFEVAAAT
jgi:hypothetical protein